MKPSVTSQNRSYLTLVVLCAVIMSLTSCFLFHEGTDTGGFGSSDGSPLGDITTFEVASTLREAGRYDEALLVYLEAIQSDPSSEVASHAMNEIGGIYIQTQEYEKSLEQFESLLAKFPAYDDAESVQKKIEFVEKAISVEQDRRKVANEGTRMKWFLEPCLTCEIS
jgi:tetratricopeptide (TPR) repeat protein